MKERRELRNDKLNHRVGHWCFPTHPGECQNSRTSKTQGSVSQLGEYGLHVYTIDVFKMKVPLHFPLENNLHFFKSLPF